MPERGQAMFEILYPKLSSLDLINVFVTDSKAIQLAIHLKCIANRIDIQNDSNIPTMALILPGHFYFNRHHQPLSSNFFFKTKHRCFVNNNDKQKLVISN